MSESEKKKIGRRKQPGRKQARYEDDFMVNAVHAVHANGGNVSSTAAQLGIPIATLHQWVRGKRVPYLLQLKTDKEGSVIKACDSAVWLLLGGIADPAAILRAPLSQRASAFGIVFDKLRVLQGLPGQYTGGQVAANADIARVMQDATPAELEALVGILDAVSKRSASELSSSPRLGGDVVSPEVVPALPEVVVPDTAEIE